MDEARHVEKPDECREQPHRYRHIPPFLHHRAQQQPFTAEPGERRQPGHGHDGNRRGCKAKGHGTRETAEIGECARACSQNDRGGDEEQDPLRHEMVGCKVECGHPA